jgi:ribosome-binding protein aMBF1 (putative translation factor)
MFLCLDQISYARDTWNLFIQLLRTIAQNKLTKNENPSNKLNKKRQIQLKQRNREANSKKKLKTTPRMW